MPYSYRYLQSHHGDFKGLHDNNLFGGNTTYPPRDFATYTSAIVHCAILSELLYLSKSYHPAIVLYFLHC